MDNTEEVKVKTAELEKQSDVAVYDFESQERIVRGRMPTLELLNERFARSMRVTLFNFFRHTVTFNVNKNHIMKFSEYIGTLKTPTSINSVKIFPMMGTALFILDAELVFTVVESFFGGDGRFGKKIETRDFTPTELRIIRRMLDMAFIDLKEAWKGLMNVDFEYQSSEMNPSMATMIAPNDIVVVSEFKIELEGGSGDFHIVIPYSILEPLKEVLDSKVHSEHGKVTDERWEKALKAEILDVEVEITSTLGKVDMTMKELLNLHAGDVIPFDMPENLIVSAQGVPSFRAKYGESSGHAALKIIEKIERPKEYKS